MRTSWRLLTGGALAAAALLLGGGPAAAADDPPVDINGLDLVPVAMDGVAGQDPARTQTPSIENLVYDVQQAGRRIFVGGAFLTVQQGKDAEPVPQPYLAAFDLDTGRWVPTCRPELDRAVYALDRTPDGKLLVGGEFEQVDGTVRRGLVALDPGSCEIDPTFAGAVDRPYSENRAVVRDLTVVGDRVYAAGNFSHLVGPDGQRARVYKVGRLDARTGRADAGFRPEVTGSGVWGMDVDDRRGRVYLTGYFSGVNGTAGSGWFHTVDTTTGASVPGLAALPRNYPRAQPEMYDVAVGDGRVFVAGEQHVLEVLDAGTHKLTAFSGTGYKPCNGDPFLYCGAFAGGAYQFAERIGDVVLAGCHCTYATRDGNVAHYNSVTGRRTPNKLTMAYDAATGRVLEDFRPDLDGSKDGSWAAASDTNGCLYLGGDYQVGGVTAGRSRWVGGVAKFCPRGWTPPERDSVPPSAPTGLEAADVGGGTVQLAWTAATDNVGVAGYQVLRDGRPVGETVGTTATDRGLSAGTTYRYTVVARDEAGNLGPAAGPVEVTPAGAAGGDVQAPTVPTGLAATAGAGGDVRLTWTASTDNVGVSGYLVYRDGGYAGWSATPAWTDPGAGAGPFEYAVRALDAIGNRSLKSDPHTWSPNGQDTTAPSVPPGLTAVAEGGGSVRLSWSSSTDDVGVASYLIYRDGGYVGWSATPGHTDRAAAGTPVTYQLRAVDRAGNRSDKTAGVTITPR